MGATELSESRVLQVVLTLTPGGTERLVVELSKRLADRFGMAVCCLDGAGAWATELTSRGIDVVALNRQPGFRPSLGARLAEVAARYRAEVLHCHHYSPFVYGSLAALGRTPLHVVYTEHGRLSDGPPSTKRKIANQIFGRLPAQIYTVSDDLKRHLSAEGFSSDRVGVIYNGIDPQDPPSLAERNRARRTLQLPPDAFVVGSVGRLDRVKDVETLLDALVRVRVRRPDAVLVVVGDGPERHRLQAIARHYELGDTVRFTGHRDDVRQLLPAFDVFANSSISEGVSLTILEAMAAALPVIATRVGGTPEVVDEGVTGVLVPARLPGPLAHAIHHLAHQPARRQSLGAEGRRRVESQFGLDQMIGQYVAVYESLLDGCHARLPRMAVAEGR